MATVLVSHLPSGGVIQWAAVGALAVRQAVSGVNESVKVLVECARPGAAEIVESSIRGLMRSSGSLMAAVVSRGLVRRWPRGWPTCEVGSLKVADIAKWSSRFVTTLASSWTLWVRGKMAGAGADPCVGWAMVSGGAVVCSNHGELLDERLEEVAGVDVGPSAVRRDGGVGVGISVKACARGGMPRWTLLQSCCHHVDLRAGSDVVCVWGAWKPETWMVMRPNCAVACKDELSA